MINLIAAKVKAFAFYAVGLSAETINAPPFKLAFAVRAGGIPSKYMQWNIKQRWAGTDARFPGWLFNISLLKIFCAKSAFLGWLLLNSSISMGQPIISQIEIQKYIEERMLFGNPTELMRQIVSEPLDASIRAIENMRRKPLTEAQKKKIFSDINEGLAKRAVPPLTTSQSTEQFDTWKRCITNSYQSGLSAKNAASLQIFVASGTYKLFPRMRRPLVEWFGTILRRIQEYPLSREKTDGETKKFSENSQLVTLRMRQTEVVTAVFGTDQQIRIVAAASGASLETVAITMMMNAEEIHKIALGQGISQAQWESVLEYAGSDLAKFEKVAYERCFEDPSLISPAVTNVTKNSLGVLNDVYKRNAELLMAN